uniref:Uncharacterized protein n=1 Tax=Arundo donax TaxID=35708 RepID=A0A0A8Z7U5_ARUDO
MFSVSFELQFGSRWIEACTKSESESFFSLNKSRKILYHVYLQERCRLKLAMDGCLVERVEIYKWLIAIAW